MDHHDIGKFDRFKSVSLVAGLLTDPTYHSNTYRLELLIHHLLSDCQGKLSPNPGTIKHWLNVYAPVAGMYYMEDPVEDVFISRVATPWGNFRFYEGIWEGNTFYLSVILNTINTFPKNFGTETLFQPITALLKLSDEIVRRNRGRLNHIAASVPKAIIQLSNLKQLQRRANSLHFSKDQLAELGITVGDLKSFLLKEEHLANIKNRASGNSPLLKYPLITVDNEIFILLPTALSWAIRFFAFRWIKDQNLFQKFHERLVLQYYKVLRELPSMGRFVHPQPPFVIDKASIHDSYFFEFIGQFDQSKAIHFIVRVDSLVGIENGPDELPAKTNEQQEEIEKRIERCREKILQDERIKEGFTIVVMAGYGRSNMFTVPYTRSNWSIAAITAHDLQVLNWSRGTDESTLYRLVKINHYLRDLKIKFINPNGLINFYGWWRESNEMIVPWNVNVGEKQDQIISIPTNSLAKIRRDACMVVDQRMVQYVDGNLRIVRKRNINSFFTKSLASRLYIDFDDIIRNPFSGCVLISSGPWWVGVRNNQIILDFKLVYRIYDAMLFWIERIADYMLHNFKNIMPSDPILFELDYSLLKPIDKLTDCRIASLEKIVTHKARHANNTIPLVLQQPFLECLHTPINISERALVRAAIEGFVNYLGKSARNVNIEQAVDSIIQNNYSRHIHGFQGNSFRDNIRHFYDSKYHVINEFDSQIFKIGLGHFNAIGEKQITGKVNCTKFINDLVAYRYVLLKQDLKKYNRAGVVFALQSNIEALHAEKKIWERTSKAVLNLHVKQQEVFEGKIKHFARITAADIMCRMLIEIALCESPTIGGQLTLSDFDFSPLMAKAMTIFHFGNLSDGIDKGVVPADILVASNGDVMFEQSFHEDILQPLVGKYETDRTIQNSNDYESFFSRTKESTSPSDIYPQAFLNAFFDEFNVSIDNILDFLDALYDQGFDQEKRVLSLRKSELLENCNSKRQITTEVVEQVLKNFSLEPRDHWEKVPYGYERRDLNPWLFRRRLSVLAKPLFKIDESDDPLYIISPGFVAEAMSYTIDLYQTCGIEVRRCKSALMKKWVGEESGKKGKVFVNKVASILNDMGFETLTEVLVSTLVSSKVSTKDYGDFDIIAWKKDDGAINLIECKDLLFAKTISEMAVQLQDYRGEMNDGEPDSLKRHIDRVEFISKYLPTLLKHLKIDNSKGITAHLIFSNPVPVLFNKELDVNVKIQSLQEIKERNFL